MQIPKLIHYRDEGWPIRQGLNIFINRLFYTDEIGGSWGWVLRINDWMWRVRWSKRTKRWNIRIYNLTDELRGLSEDCTETVLRRKDGDRPDRGPRWRRILHD